jgi:DNA repair protein RecO (recombination protein O)
MQTSEAFLLRKFEYSEADYIISAFTRDFGKIRGLAKNAKKSRKRFGGRLEPFVHLRIRFSQKPGGMKFIEDAETIKVFSNIMEDIELFAWGNFVLENIDVTLPEEEPNNNIFELLIHTLSSLSKDKHLPSKILNFQVSLLSYSGYKPNFENCAGCGKPVDEGVFSIAKGGVLCSECRGSKPNGFLLSKNFLSSIGSNEMNAERAFDFIRMLYRFTEYHTGKEIKSSKFVEEIMR